MESKVIYVLVDQGLLSDDMYEYNTDVDVFETFEKAWERLVYRYNEELAYCVESGIGINIQRISKVDGFAKIDADNCVSMFSIHKKELK